MCALFKKTCISEKMFAKARNFEKIKITCDEFMQKDGSLKRIVYSINEKD